MRYAKPGVEGRERVLFAQCSRLLKYNSKNSRGWTNCIFTSELLLDHAKKEIR
jgi:hypothetical protein